MVFAKLLSGAPGSDPAHRHGKKAKKTRYRLHVRQEGKCYYCKREIGIMLDHRQAPVLEHYIPQAQGGRRVVLACNWCDKRKGMIPGPDFEALLAEHGLTAENFQKVHGAVQKKCKAINRILQAAHPANQIGQALVTSRYCTIQDVVHAVVDTTTDSACVPSHSGQD